MRALALALTVALAGPVGAEDAALCQAVWARLSAGVGMVFPLSGTIAADPQGCVVHDLHVDFPDDYTPDWVADELRLTGAALGRIAGDPGATPLWLEAKLTGLRFQVSTGMAQIDYVFAAQARANPIHADLALAWDSAARALTVERLAVDFPGENSVHLSAELTGVDLSSVGAAQMSLTSAALRQADLSVQSQGLFEWYLLSPLTTALLPPEGDMAAEVAALQARATAAVLALPEAQFPGGTRAALAAMIAELPNPRGTLTLAFRADPGFGATRLTGYAATGAPSSLEEAAPILNGVTVEIGWSRADDR